MNSGGNLPMESERQPTMKCKHCKRLIYKNPRGKWFHWASMFYACGTIPGPFAEPETGAE